MKAMPSIVLALWLCCLAGTSDAAQQAKALYLENIIMLMQTEWPKNRTVNIVFHGHSVPSGYAKTPFVDTFNAYPHLLHRALKEKYPYAVINVIVTGIGGETSNAGAVRFKRDVLSHRPDLVTIDYGLGDTIIGLEKSHDAMTAMIEAAKVQGVKVILLTPTPDTRAEHFNPQDRLNKVSVQLRNLASQHQIGLADSHAAFKQYVKDGGKMEDLMSQVNHPNRSGHELVAKELLKWFP